MGRAAVHRLRAGSGATATRGVRGVTVLALSGTTVDHLPRYAAALVLLVLAVLVLRTRLRLAFAGWLVAVCFVPVWAGITLKVDLEPHVVASVGLVVCLLPVAARRRGTAARFTWGDALFLGFFATSLLAAFAGRLLFTDLFVLAVQWGGAFLAGRLIGYRVPLPQVFGAVAVAFTVVAVLTLVEFATGFNPFVLVPGSGSLHQIWSTIQVRGGQARAEGAFGSSIALGAGLALAVPLTLAAPFKPALRLAMVVLMLAASVVTFSRIGLVTAVIGLVVTVLLLRGALPLRLRATVSVGLAVVALASSSLLDRVFTAAGTEASDSASYRITLLELVPTMRPFGSATSMYRLPTGERFFGSFHSIDNALLLLGLTYGWVPLAFVVGLFLLGLGCLASGRVTAPTIAVLAQLPAFGTVALITQYSTLTWFVAGLAVFAQSTRRRPAASGGAAPAAVEAPVPPALAAVP